MAFLERNQVGDMRNTYNVSSSAVSCLYLFAVAVAGDKKIVLWTFFSLIITNFSIQNSGVFPFMLSAWQNIF